MVLTRKRLDHGEEIHALAKIFAHISSFSLRSLRLCTLHQISKQVLSLVFGEFATSRQSAPPEYVGDFNSPNPSSDVEKYSVADYLLDTLSTGFPDFLHMLLFRSYLPCR